MKETFTLHELHKSVAGANHFMPNLEGTTPKFATAGLGTTAAEDPLLVRRERAGEGPPPGVP